MNIGAYKKLITILVISFLQIFIGEIKADEKVCSFSICSLNLCASNRDSSSFCQKYINYI